jgi:hypothetical protein
MLRGAEVNYSVTDLETVTPIFFLSGANKLKGECSDD